jgi:hypothetical protein
MVSDIKKYLHDFFFWVLGFFYALYRLLEMNSEAASVKELVGERRRFMAFVFHTRHHLYKDMIVLNWFKYHHYLELVEARKFNYDFIQNLEANQKDFKDLRGRRSLKPEMAPLVQKQLDLYSGLLDRCKETSLYATLMLDAKPGLLFNAPQVEARYRLLDKYLQAPLNYRALFSILKEERYVTENGVWVHTAKSLGYLFRFLSDKKLFLDPSNKELVANLLIEVFEISVTSKAITGSRNDYPQESQLIFGKIFRAYLVDS